MVRTSSGRRWSFFRRFRRPFGRLFRRRLPLKRELKRDTHTAVSEAISTGKYWDVGAQIAQGATAHNRVGNEIQVASITLKATIYNDSTDTGETARQRLVRVLIVQFHGPEVTTGYWPSAGTLVDLYSALPLHGGKVLFDQLFYPQIWNVMDSSEQATVMPEHLEINYYKKFKKGVLVGWTDNATPVRNNIVVYLIASGANKVYWNSHIRCTFYDV